MIIKRNLRSSSMPSLKRCDFPSSNDDEDGGDPMSLKKQRIACDDFSSAAMTSSSRSTDASFSGEVGSSGYLRRSSRLIQKPSLKTLDSDFADKGGSFIDLRLNSIELYEKEEVVLYLACRNFNCAKKCVTMPRQWQSCNFEGKEFASGDVVWAKFGKKYPVWPAIVVDLMVLSSEESYMDLCVPGAILVMFLGYLGAGNKTEYEWVKQEMIFPFLDNLERFQGQSSTRASPVTYELQ